MDSPNSRLLLQFGARIRALREKREMSQETLAELTKLDRTYISGIERGRRNLGLLNIGRLAQALDVSLALLFDGLIPDDGQQHHE
jgi:transcriptional regulator with XRE-family HTH domain